MAVSLRFLSAVLPALLLGLAASVDTTADEFSYVADHHEWQLTCNKDGFTLTSRYPVARFFEAGAGSTVTVERETLYLGRSCDASHKHLGKGKFCQANSGFWAEFEKDSIGFPRQEIICPQESDDPTGCGC